MAIIHTIREKIRKQEYEFTIPHFFEEMAIYKGRVNRKFICDPRGTRYEVIGSATDEREIAIICRIKNTGKLLLITAYALEG